VDGNGRIACQLMHLVGYPVAISGDNESRLACYQALQSCNLEGDNAKLLILIGCAVQKAALYLLEIYA